ncbi:MAG: serine/threonine protein kinase [Phycisphaerales bacterium]|nr:serine/threonine protein kinase [Phycisphaerales bacterium]
MEPLGEGGFGVVYLAEQTAPVRRQVALKVLKPGMDSAAVLARFEAERQALALMEHAGICKVLDAGATPQGRPYFAMELVRGVPITDYCNMHRLGMVERLTLFVDVCLAVQHAHQKGIIHRDLKPTNILVAMTDKGPAAKVIDFGIAKAMRGSLGGHTVHTAMGQFIGTPEYMSPEQAASGGVDIDTRTDVYSLGVVLYELLTGVLPIDSERLRRAGSHDIPRILLESEPSKPSTRLIGLPDGAAVGPGGGGDWAANTAPASGQAIARQRGTDRSSLVRQVRGDLDWITMKAMDKDRVRRYESAGALAADIGRHLSNEPVLAGPPSAGYRMSKFVRRHRGGVAASVLIALSIMVGLVISVIQYRQADAQRKIAEQESKKFQATLGFMTGMFGAVDPEKSRGRDVTVKDVLDNAASQAEKDLASEPEVRAEVLEILGEAYHTTSRFDEAIRLMTGAIDARKSVGLVDDVRFYQLHAKLSAPLMSADRLDESEAALKTALDGRSRLLGADHPDTLFSKSLLAMLYQLRGNNAEAETILRDVIKSQTRVVGEGDSATLDSRTQLADLLQEAGKFDDARAEAQEIADLSKKHLGADSTYTLQAQSILASILFSMGRDAEAEQVIRETLEGKKKVFGATHTQVFTTADVLLQILTRQKKLDEAVELGRDLVEKAKASLGPDHRSTQTYMNNWANALVQKKEFAQAEAIFREILASPAQSLAPTSIQTLATKNSLGNLLCDAGRPEEGYKVLDEVRLDLEKTLPPDHWILGLSRSHVGQALVDLSRNDEAKAMLEDGYGRLVKALGAGHPHAIACAKSLADLYQKLGDTEKEGVWRVKAQAGGAAK